jgi:hypothetical protein
MAGIKIVNLPALGRNLASTDLFELSLAGGTGSRKITGQEIISAIPSGITIGTTAITSGVVGRVLFEGTGNVVQESANLFWDNSTQLLQITTSNTASASRGLGVTQYGDFIGGAPMRFDKYRGSLASPQNVSALDIVGAFTFNPRVGGSLTSDRALFGANMASTTGIGIFIIGGTANGSYNPGIYVHPTNNVTIGSSQSILTGITDAGFKLDVNGTARVSGRLDNTIVGAGTSFSSGTAGTNTVKVGIYTDNSSYAAIYTEWSHDLRLGTGGSVGSTNNTIIFKDSNKYFGICVTPTARLHVKGSGSTTATSSLLIENSSATELFRVRDNGNIQIGTTTDDGYKLDVNGTARVQGQATIAGTTNASAGFGRNALINGTINATANTQTLVGLDIEPTFNTGAFTGVEALALRVTGFVSNFTSGGATQIRIIGPSNANKSLFFFNSSTTFASTRIYNQGTNNNFVIATGDSLSNPTDRFTIFASTGNVGINTTTDAGYKLDVNGTARVSGQFDVISGTANFRVNNNSTYVQLGIGSTAWIQYNATETYLQSTNIFFQNASSILYASGRGIFGSSSLNNSAQFQVDSTTKGFLPPRMTQAQRNAIASPAIGLEIYQTDATEGKYIYKSSGWTYIG